MFDPHNLSQLLKLKQAIKASQKELAPFAEVRMEAYRQFVGAHYGKHGCTEKVPLNLIELAFSILMQHLVAADPRVNVVADKDEVKAYAYSFELAMNKIIGSMGLKEVLSDWCAEALMAPFGVVKCSLDISSLVEVEPGLEVVVGQPIVETVLFDDWVHDMSARSLEKAAFMGNRYFVPKDSLTENPIYDPEVARKLASYGNRSALEGNEETDSQKLSRSQNIFTDDYREMVELWDIWLPEEQLVLTVSLEHESCPPLRVVQWEGPEEGPYHFLYFQRVPGNTLPLPPVATWIDLHEMTNKLFNKLGRQAERQKTITGVPTSATADGERIIKANDGDMISLDQPGAVQQFSTGGIDQNSFGFTLQNKDLFNWFSGNLAAIGGLGTSSDTFGQDKLLTDSASGRVKSMQSRVHVATRRLTKSLGYWLWHDPLAEVPITKTIQGTTETVASTWTPQMMPEGAEFYEYHIDVEPYSLQGASPAERLSTLTNFFTQILLPSVELMGAQGISVDMEGLIKLTSKYANLPELAGLVKFTEGESQPSDSLTPKTTTRRYERVSRPGASDKGKEAVLINSLMGGKNQASEQAQLAR